MFATKLDWVADGYVLVAGENLIDLERRTVLWQYQHDGAGTPFKTSGELGGAFWYGLTSRDRSAMGLFRTNLPHSEATRVASSLKADDLLAVKPGAKLSLRLNMQGTPEEQQRVRQALTSQLQELGMSVVEGSRLILEASTEKGKSREIKYERFGRSGQSESATVTEQISRLRFIENDRTLWDASSISGAPHLLNLKNGQSLQDALAPYQQPNLEFFSVTKLPQHVARPNEKGAFGASLLNSQGIQSATVRSPTTTDAIRAEN